MGKIIICKGKTANRAYEFIVTGTRVRTIEEMCYYVCHSVDSLADELIDRKIPSFLKDELGLRERGQLVDELQKRRAGISELAVAILCSADYLTENEILSVVERIKELESLSPVARRRRRGDYCMQHGMYREAMKEYQGILAEFDVSELTDAEYASVLHNRAVLLAKAGEFADAAAAFRDAYERNNSRLSLKCYLYALQLGGKNEQYQSEMINLADEKGLLEEMENEQFMAAETARKTADSIEVQHIKLLFKEGRATECNTIIDDLIKRKKNKYRAEVL